MPHLVQVLHVNVEMLCRFLVSTINPFRTGADDPGCHGGRASQGVTTSTFSAPSRMCVCSFEGASSASCSLPVQDMPSPIISQVQGQRCALSPESMRFEAENRALTASITDATNLIFQNFRSPCRQTPRQGSAAGKLRRQRSMDSEGGHRGALHTSLSNSMSMFDSLSQ